MVLRERAKDGQSTEGDARAPVLLVTATLFELAPFLKRHAVDQACNSAGQPGTLLHLGLCDLLVTGVGQLQCAAHLSRALAAARYELIVQAGIAGSFTERFPKGAVVRVMEEVCGDLGAENRGSFLHLSEMGFLNPDQPPFTGGKLIAPALAFRALSEITGVRIAGVRSVTVNRVLSEAASIEWMRTKFSPDVVNMEGAALFYVALLAGVPFVELRAISDMVGPRDKDSWDISGAIEALDGVLGAFCKDW